MKEVYVLTDSDGDAICAFTDKEQAIKEARDCGCDVQEVRLVIKDDEQ